MASPFPTLTSPFPALTPYSADLSRLPVAVYARLSQNPDGTRDSVATQVKIGKAEAAARWPGRPVVVFSDDDISARDDDLGRNPEELRPGYKALCNAIKRGQVGAVLVRWQSRISRGEAVWPHWKTVCLLAGITVLHTWLEGDIDITPGGALAGDIRNRFNVEFSIKTRIATKDTLNSRASEGRPPGGRRYGFTKERNEHGEAILVQVPEQAETLRRMAEWALAGESQSDIARRLNAEGSRTATGALWRRSKIRDVLCNPMVAGLRTHQVAKARAARGPDAKPHPYDGIVGRGTWEPIIPEDQWRLLVAHFTGDRVVMKEGGPIKVKASRRGTARTYLLSGGLIRCGKCGARLVSGSYLTRYGTRMNAYRCQTLDGGCGGTSISAPACETWAVAETLRYLDDGETVRRLMAEGDGDAAKRAEIIRRREALQAQRDELATAAVAEGLSLSMVAAMERKIADAEAELVAHEAALSVPVAVIDFGAVSAAWDGLTFGERRTVLFALGALLTVGPALGGTAKPESRLSIDFGHTPAPRERSKPRRSKAATRTT